MYYTKFTDSQKENIRKALNPEDRNSLFSRLLEELKVAFRPNDVDKELFDYSRQFDFTSKGLAEFADALKPFEGVRADLQLRTDDERGEVYFDLLKDVFDVGREIGYLVQINNHHLQFSFFNLRYCLDMSRKYYLKQLDSTVFYFYQKDKWGLESCYSVPESEVPADIKMALKRLTDDYPVEIIRQDEPIQPDDDEVTKARKQAIATAVEEGMQFPMLLVKHPDDDLDYKFECFQWDNEIDYMQLLHECAQGKEFKIEPTYIAENSITPKAAEQNDMEFLAQVMRERNKV